jgi:putative ABC transport system permease protein
MFLLLKLIKESFIFALQSVIVNKLRTALSLLGITIGIFAIISVFTIVDSLETNIRTSLNSLGTNIVYVMKWPWTEENGAEYQWWKYVNRPVPSFEEYREIEYRSTMAQDVGFVVSARETSKYENNKIENTQFIGVSNNIENIRTIEIEKGRYFTSFEINSGRNICVIGYSIAKNLFPNSDPLGKVLRVKGFKLKVIGVITKEGKSTFSDSMDEAVILPVTYIRNIIDIKSEDFNPELWVRAKPGVSNEELIDELRQILRSVRRLKPNADDNFALNQTSMINKELDGFFRVLNMAGWFIGLFSLLVGGFGIANIMFVGVKERTTQIGIQKALGAKRFFILAEFLFEAVLLSVFGGAVGLILVWSGTILIDYLAGFNIDLTIGNIVLGLGISSLIGLISGLAPAWAAARMDPVTAINTSF